MWGERDRIWFYRDKECEIRTMNGTEAVLLLDLVPGHDGNADRPEYK